VSHHNRFLILRSKHCVPQLVAAAAPVDETSHVVLVDGSGYIFRAYHALPPLTRKTDGLPIGAVAGFSDKVSMLDTMKDRHISFDQVFEKFGVAPNKVIDIQSLAGDSVDNVPGVPGIGVKTAALLINEYGDLDTLLERAGEIKQKGRREKLLEFADNARISRELVTLKRDIELETPIEELAITDPEPSALFGFLEDMTFRTLTARVRAAIDYGDDEGLRRADTQASAPDAPRDFTFDRDKYACVQEPASSHGRSLGGTALCA